MTQNVSPSAVVKSASLELKGKIEMPQWALFVKTGMHKERPPEDANWWYMRAASVLRRISEDGPVGVQKLRTYYGGLHRRGHKPARFARGSGKIVRVILQDLEKAGYIKKEKKGRILTAAGQKFLAKASKASG